MSDQILIQLCILQTNQKCLGFTFFSLHFSQCYLKRKKKNQQWLSSQGKLLKAQTYSQQGVKKKILSEVKVNRLSGQEQQPEG